MKFNSSKYRNFPILRPDLIPKFWEKIDRSGRTQESQAAMLAGRVQTPCYLWLVGKHLDGYGTFPWSELNHKHQIVHRCSSHVLAYFLTKNDLPQERNLELDHLCRIRHCCNPDHLEPVVHTVNSSRGNKVGKIKIPGDIIYLIEYLHHSCYGWTQQQIADFVGTSQPHISRILSGKCRKVVA